MASLADSLWHRNRVLAEAALAHPFVQGIASGELARATFAYYVGQDAAFLDAFCRAYALALAKTPDQDGLIAFRELLDHLTATLEPKLPGPREGGHSWGRARKALMPATCRARPGKR